MNKNAFIFVTTKNRADLLSSCLKSIFAQIEKCPNINFKIFVISDDTDSETFEVLSHYHRQVTVLSFTETNGLPMVYNLILDLILNYTHRHEVDVDYIGYFQDDVVIDESQNYFELASNSLESKIENKKLDFFTGFYTPLHPGYKTIELEGEKYLVSDSLDGKNFFCKAATLLRIGQLPNRLADGRKRGNPGPVNGSGFDIWLWRDSPFSSTKVGNVNLCKVGLVETTGAHTSTWANRGDKFWIKVKRVMSKKVHSKHLPLKKWV